MSDQPRPRLDWSKSRVSAAPEPCVICGKPALMRSPDRDVPCHKTCAEQWLGDHDR